MRSERAAEWLLVTGFGRSALEFLEGGDDADGGGFGEGGAVEREEGEGVGGLGGDGL